MALPTCYTPCPVSLSDQLVGEDCGYKPRIFLNPRFAKADFLTVLVRNIIVLLLLTYGRTGSIDKSFRLVIAQGCFYFHSPCDQIILHFCFHSLTSWFELIIAIVFINKNRLMSGQPISCSYVSFFTNLYHLACCPIVFILNWWIQIHP